MVTLFGIKNCDTVTKARKWLDARGIDYRFHDVRSEGIDEAQLRSWVEELGWEVLVNRRGTTWRRLPQQAREGIDQQRAVELMLHEPSLIKRPVLDLGTSRHVGFKEQTYAQLFDTE